MQSLGFSHMKVFTPSDEYGIHLDSGYTLDAHFETISKDLSQHIRRRDIETYPCISSGKGSESLCRCACDGLCIGKFSIVLTTELLSIYTTL
jgi:hypothetical protein